METIVFQTVDTTFSSTFQRPPLLLSVDTVVRLPTLIVLSFGAGKGRSRAERKNSKREFAWGRTFRQSNEATRLSRLLSSDGWNPGKLIRYMPRDKQKLLLRARTR